MTSMTKLDRRLCLVTLVSLGIFGCFASTNARHAAHQPARATERVVIPIELRGAETDGGIDGTVVRVTSLAAEGPGSLKAALQTKGPRLVIFDVGGVIDLGGRTLTVREPHLTLAGQTAPDPGITLIRGGLIVETHDVVIQHIAVRPGDDGPAGTEWAPDALGVRRGNAGPVHDVVFDHCSATWAIDENLSTSGPGDVEDGSLTAHDITIRNCLIAEALSHSRHPKGEHSKGTLVHDGVRNVRIEGCVYAHNQERNPRIKGGASAIVLDSVMYNWGSACVGVGVRGNQKMLAPAEVTLAGNVAIAGPNTKGKTFVKSVDPGGRAALRDNLLFGVAAHDDRVVVEEAPIQARTPRIAAERALRSAGARPARRDPIDARIIQSVIDGTGRIIDSQRDAGGYPARAATTRVLEVPKDRRAWLDRLSNELALDASLDVKPLWTRLER
jgi:hypothetical protein